MATALPAWPETNHPLNAVDAERSEARVADIELGLTHPVDGSYWRGKREQRIEALEEDGEMYGLAPHEEVELQRLKALRDRDQPMTESQDVCDHRRGFHGFPPPVSSTGRPAWR